MSKPSGAAPQTPTPASFEAALQELENIVAALETGEAPLEDSLAAYARGATLIRQCQETLASAEQKLRILDADVLRDADAAALRE